jgi:hypothetical protein
MNIRVECPKHNQLSVQQFSQDARTLLKNCYDCRSFREISAERGKNFVKARCLLKIIQRSDCIVNVKHHIEELKSKTLNISSKRL